MSRTFRIIEGDALEVAQGLPAESVQCVVTSVPYYKKRDYKVSGQIGQEPSPELFIARLLYVFREVRRTLRKDGVCWVNIADTYAKKERLGIPHRLALALQTDGWKWRDEVIWHKPSTMTESVRDRCTQAHEFIFMFTRSRRYFYDNEAIAEPAQDWGERDRSNGKYTSGEVPIAGGKHHGLTGVRAQKRRALELAAEKGLTPDHLAAIRSAGMTDAGKAQATQLGFGKNTEEVQRLAAEAKEALGGYYREFLSGETRNRRSVWSVPPKPSREEHYAAYPPDLIEPCILAGSKEGDLVYDPFGGSGTTGLVALRLNRNAILSELNPTYCEMARQRIWQDAPLLNTEAAA